MMCCEAAAQCAGGHTDVALREDIFEIARVCAVDAKDDVVGPEGGADENWRRKHHKISGLKSKCGTCPAC